MAQKRDYYEVLGIGKNATDAEIKSAYRKLDVHSKQELLDFVLNGDSPVQDERCCQQQ